MIRQCLLIIAVFISTLSCFADEGVKKLNWNGIEVVWLEDNRFPTYNVLFYFGDGAISDNSKRMGETSWMFALLSSGTRRFSRSEIKDNLDYFGASYGGSVSHEYSEFQVSGLVKDILPTMKKICHIFDDANFPVGEIKKLKKRVMSSKKNLVSSHASIGQMAFRELSMSGTPFGHSSEGKLKDIKYIKQKYLLKRLEFFNKKVFKRIYITGPKNTLSIKNIIMNECGWSGQGINPIVKTSVPPVAKKNSPKIHLITVPKANQVQIHIGRYTTPGELSSDVTNAIASGIIAGSPLGVLSNELRNVRGLTYGASSFITMQRDYGRIAISTTTKSESAVEVIKVIKDVLSQVSVGKFPLKKFEMIKSSEAGAYPFALESNLSYLNTLLFMDHTEQDYSRFHSYPTRINKVSAKDMQSVVEKAFDWNQMTIVVVGEKRMAKFLKTLGPVKVTSYRNFL